MAYRVDTGRLSKVERTPQGGIRADAAVARAGVLVYPWGREYRPPDENDSPSMRAGLEGAPVTVGHPLERKVTADNIERLQVGHAGDSPRADGDHMVTKLYIQAARAVGPVEARRLSEISLGYDCDIDPTPGVAPNGERYDTIQRNIRPNHIALLPAGHGRAGSTVALRLDSRGDAVIDDAPPRSGGEEDESIMKFTVRVDGVDYLVEAESQALAQAIARERAAHEAALRAASERADAAEKARDEAQGRADSLERERDELKESLVEASSPERLDAMVKARSELEGKARGVLGEKADFTGKTDREVMEMVLRADAKGADLSTFSDDYIRGAFGARIVPVKAPYSAPRLDALDELRQLLEGAGRNDGALNITPNPKLGAKAQAAALRAYGRKGR